MFLFELRSENVDCKASHGHLIQTQGHLLSPILDNLSYTYLFGKKISAGGESLWLDVWILNWIEKSQKVNGKINATETLICEK